MTRNSLLVGCIVCMVMSWPALAASARYAIRADQVATAVSRMGVNVVAGQVTLLSNVVAASPDSELQVQSMERLGNDRFMTRLACASSEDCLPFMASLLVSHEEAAQLTMASSRLSVLKGNDGEPGPQPRTGVLAVRNGAPAILQLDGGHVHIRIPVICLQGGSEGQTVRVSSPDHRKVYAAKVAGEGLLQGRL